MTTIGGIVLIVLAVAIVAWPLLKRVGRSEVFVSTEDVQLENLLTQKVAAFSALDELDSDYEMGNLSSSDYGELKTRYEQKAVSLMRELDELQEEHSDDIEREIQELRGRSKSVTEGQDAATFCTGCGAELAADDNFCSQCGERGRLVCPGCSAEASSSDIFCSQCGVKLDGQEHV